MITVWQSLSSAPHRLFFLAGAVQALLAMMLWFALLAGRQAGMVPDLPLPQAWLHGWLMLFGMLPFFVTGFTLTAVPNWLGESGIDRATWVRAFVPMLAGVLLVYLGLWLGSAVLVAGIGLHWAGWAWGTLAAQRLIDRSRHPGKRHFYMAIAVIVCGLCAEVTFVAAVLTGKPVFNAIARSAALWLFLLPTFFSISHRVVPLFTRMAVRDAPLYQPLWMLPLMTFACLGHFALEVAELPHWLWLADLPLLAMALLLSARWGFRRNVGHPLVGVHHLSFAWLSLAMALYLAQSLGAALGLAPMHALVTGYFGSMLLGMSARIVIAHSGRTIEFTPALRAAFLIYQAVPVLRILAEIPQVAGAQANLFYLGSGALWLACWGVWCHALLPLLHREPATGNSFRS